MQTTQRAFTSRQGATVIWKESARRCRNRSLCQYETMPVFLSMDAGDWMLRHGRYDSCVRLHSRAADRGIRLEGDGMTNLLMFSRLWAPLD